MDETPSEKATRYLKSIETVLSRIEFSKPSCTVDGESIGSVVAAAKSYVEDARHYLRDKPSTALAAVSYAEGLLDALRLLGAAKFTWPNAKGDTG